MLIWLAEYLQQFVRGFAVVQYLSMRAILSVLTALGISLLLGPQVIQRLIDKQLGQTIRSDGPESHLEKAGTPTMGGALILLSICITTLLWADISHRYVQAVLAITIFFGAIGWVDDYRKIVQKNSRGLIARWKYFWQSVGGLGAALFLYYSAQSPQELELIVPFFKTVGINIGLLYIVLTYFVIVGTSNAVNLTDGLDGLAVMPVMIAAAALGVLAYAVGRVDFTQYLDVHYVPGTGELLIFCMALIGGGLGFLWYNAPPAAIFMGDTGSLSLGGALGAIAVLTKHEIVWAIIGGVFVAEALSVIIQVFWFKRTGRRVFLMAPIHHHFEKKGMSEEKIVVRFWIVAILLVAIGLATLKLR